MTVEQVTLQGFEFFLSLYQKLMISPLEISNKLLEFYGLHQIWTVCKFSNNSPSSNFCNF